MNELPEIPGYSIQQPIGRGGMAVVYLAVQESLGRKVALKVMEPALATDRLLCERFIKEGQFVARMSSHPNIVTVYDIGCHGQCYYMAMEYIPSGSLKDRLQAGQRPQQPLAIIRGIATALGHAHTGGIIHRDVKPGNILFREDGTPVLTDFGIAKAEDADTQFTRIGTTVGSPAYMSLEQRTGGLVDARSDLYSLGIVLFELLTGDKPFSGNNPVAMGQAQKRGQIPLLPDDLYAYQHMIDRLLATDPADRYQHASELIDAIDAFLRRQEDTPGFDAAHTQERSRSERHSRAGRRFAPVAGWTLGALAIAGLAALGYYFLKPMPAGKAADEAQHPAAAAVQDDAEDAADGRRQEKIRRLLSIASAHMAVGRLTGPPGSNAYEAYRLVLEIDPENPEARRGLARIDALLAEQPQP